MYNLKYITLALISITYAISALADTNEYCIEQWPGDYRMQEYCVEQQTTANTKLFNLGRSLGLVKEDTLRYGSDGGDGGMIVYNCMEEWELQAFNTHDFTMVVYCIDLQIESYIRTHGRGKLFQPKPTPEPPPPLQTKKKLEVVPTTQIDVNEIPVSTQEAYRLAFEYLLSGNKHLNNKEYANAIKEYKKGLEIKPDYGTLKLQLSEAEKKLAFPSKPH